MPGTRGVVGAVGSAFIGVVGDLVGRSLNLVGAMVRAALLLALPLASSLSAQHSLPSVRPSAPHRARSARMAAAGFPYTFLTLQPTLTLADAAGAKVVLDRLLASSKDQSDLVYCGWSQTRSVDDPAVVGSFNSGPGDKLFLRLGYPNAAAFAKHSATVIAITILPTLKPSLKKPSLHGTA